MNRIDEILSAKRTAVFVETVEARLRELGMSHRNFAIQVYGVDERGKPKDGGRAGKILSGKSRAQLATLKQWEPVLGIPASELRALYDRPLPQEVTSERERERVISPRKALEVFMGPAPAPKAQDQIALTVDNHGRATLRLHLVSIPLRDALAIIELVKADVTEERNDDGS